MFSPPTSPTAVVIPVGPNTKCGPRSSNPLDGDYYPAAPGARTIRDSKPLYVGHDLVTAHIGRDVMIIFVSCKAIYNGPVPEAITQRHHVNPFIQQYVADWADNN